MESEIRLSRKCVCSLYFSFTNVLIQLASVIDEISFFKFFSLSLTVVRCLFLSIDEEEERESREQRRGSPVVLVTLSFSIEMKGRRGKGKEIVDNLPMFRCICCRRLMSLALVEHHQETLVVVNAILHCESY